MGIGLVIFDVISEMLFIVLKKHVPYIHLSRSTFPEQEGTSASDGIKKPGINTLSEYLEITPPIILMF